MATTYAVDIRRLSYPEPWRIARGGGFLVAAGHKLLGIPRNLATRVTRLDSLTRVAEGDVPPDVRGLVGQSIAEWQALGFALCFYYTIPAVRPGNRSLAAALLSADGAMVAQVLFVEVSLQGITRREVALNCFIPMSDGSVLGTTTERRRFNPPPGFRAVRLPGRPPAELYKRALREVRGAAGSYPVAQTPQNLPDLIVGINQKHVDYQVSRGVYVPVDAGL